MEPPGAALGSVLSGLLILFAVLTLYAFNQSKEATSASKLAERRLQDVREAQREEREARAKDVANEYFNNIRLAQHELREGRVTQADALLSECPKNLRGWEWSYLKRLCHVELLTLPLNSHSQYA
jgi:hypothetical protein